VHRTKRKTHSYEQKQFAPIARKGLSKPEGSRGSKELLRSKTGKKEKAKGEEVGDARSLGVRKGMRAEEEEGMARKRAGVDKSVKEIEEEGG